MEEKSIELTECVAKRRWAEKTKEFVVRDSEEEIEQHPRTPPPWRILGEEKQTRPDEPQGFDERLAGAGFSMPHSRFRLN